MGIRTQGYGGTTYLTHAENGGSMPGSSNRGWRWMGWTKNNKSPPRSFYKSQMINVRNFIHQGKVWILLIKLNFLMDML